MRSLRHVEEVVGSGMCTGCGLCASIAPDKISMGLNVDGNMRPLQSSPLSEAEQETFEASCPGIEVRGPGRPANTKVDVVIGPFRELHRSWSSDDAVRFKAAAGGTLTALGRYLLASGEVEAIVQVRSNPERPWLTDSVVSLTEEEVIAGAQSRYGPSAPLVNVHRLLDQGTRFVVIAKPCDISAIRALAKVDPRVNQQIPFLLTIFCGGVHNAHVPKAIMRHHGLDEDEVAVVRYRGEGWPGPMRVQAKDGRQFDMEYNDVWTKKKWKYALQFRCKVCPDAVGESADISVPDGWVLKDGRPTYEEAPGTNAAVVRTPKGQDLVRRAVEAGYLDLDPLSLEEARQMHVSHMDRKLTAQAQLHSVRAAGEPATRATNYRLWSTLRSAGLRRLWSRCWGTWRRVKRGDNRESLI